MDTSPRFSLEGSRLAVEEHALCTTEEREQEEPIACRISSKSRIADDAGSLQNRALLVVLWRAGMRTAEALEAKVSEARTAESEESPSNTGRAGAERLRESYLDFLRKVEDAEMAQDLRRNKAGVSRWWTRPSHR